MFLGIAVAMVANLWIEAPDDLPGVALGSEALLMVERAVAFSVAWLLLLVVAAQALSGRLPIEVSGRGVRYADVAKTEQSIAGTEQALRWIDWHMDDLRSRVARLEVDEGERDG